MSNNWIGLIGRNGSGKSMVCRYLEKQGYYMISLSDIVREYADEIGESKDRDTLIRLSNFLKETHGFDYYAKQCISKIRMKGVDRVVFDSVRHPDEIHYLKTFNTHFIGIDASLEIRYERIKARKDSTDYISFDVFKAQDELEYNGKSSGQMIYDCLKLCEYNISNNSDEEQLYKSIEHVLQRIN